MPWAPFRVWLLNLCLCPALAFASLQGGSQTAETQLADIKSLHDPDLPLVRVLFWGISGVCLAGLVTALLLFWRRQRARKPLARARATGHSQEEHWSVGAKRQLSDLAHEPADFETLREQVFSLSALMRELLGHLTSQSVTELTRSEIALRISPVLEPALGQRVNEFFVMAELIQFARQRLAAGRYAQEHALVLEVLNLALERQRHGFEREAGNSAGGQVS